MTNPDMPGVEKLAATRVPQAFLDKPAENLPSVFGGAGLVFVKFTHVVRIVSSMFFARVTRHTCLQRGLTGGALLPPFSIGYVKGWKRATMALIVLQCIRELQLEEQVPHRVKVSCILALQKAFACGSQVHRRYGGKISLKLQRKNSPLPNSA